ncbi:MAG: rhodanese-like domain-containing protein [Xanthomonadales bacterium]|nr:rhodanese-like domain-containing protein [Xanthomonadales bacterium]
MDRLPEFIGNHPLLAAAFVGLLVAWIGWEISQRFRGFRSISSAQLVRLMNDDGLVLFDVSSHSDYQAGHIAQARHLPPSQVDPDGKELAALREKPIALYCKSGVTAGTVAAKLAKAGFTQVHVLKGGLQSWLGDSLPLAKGKR